MMDYAVLDRDSLVARHVTPALDARTLHRFLRWTKLAAVRRVLQATLPAQSRTHALRKEVYKEALYHDCPDEISQLASVLLEPEPTLPGFTPLQLSAACYGSVPKTYIECTRDRAVTPWLQERMYRE